MFKVLFILALLGFNQAQAESKSIEVLGAIYYAKYETIEIAYKGTCEAVDLQVRGCTDLVAPYKCIADLKAVSNQSCESQNTQRFIVIPREEIKIHDDNLMSKKYKNSTLIIRGANSEAQIQLRRI